jgi:hypothetical protein
MNIATLVGVDDNFMAVGELFMISGMYIQHCGGLQILIKKFRLWTPILEVVTA